jgi:hypothetical protein
MVLWVPAQPRGPRWHFLQLLLIGLFYASKLVTYAVLPLGRTVFLFLACSRSADEAAVAGGRELAATGANSVTNVLVLPPEAPPILPYQMDVPGYDHPEQNWLGHCAVPVYSLWPNQPTSPARLSLSPRAFQLPPDPTNRLGRSLSQLINHEQTTKQSRRHYRSL